MAVFSRRSVLRGTLGLSLAKSSAAFAQSSAPALLGAAGKAFDTDVAIIGAGAAGLACARECQRLGRSFVLIEARNRIGGRVFTDYLHETPVDAGALYIHWSEKNPWAEIARSASTATVDSDSLPSGSRFFAADQAMEPPARRSAFAQFEGLLDTDKGVVPDVSLLERAGSDPDFLRSANAIGRMSVGDEPGRISALDYSRLWSGTDLIVPDGYGKLVASWGADLPVKLNTLLSRVDYRDSGVRLTTSGGTLSARTAVITVPVGVLQAERISFDPPLPRETLSGLEGLSMGALTKMALRFDGERFGIDLGTDLWDTLADGAILDFECWPFDRDVMMVYFGGDYARNLAKQGEVAAVAEMMRHLHRLIGQNPRPHLLEGKLYGWSEDSFAMGCYSHAKPGLASARAALARPIADKLFLAGEATGGETPQDAFGGAMTAGGAYLAGRSAARAAHALMGS